MGDLYPLADQEDCDCLLDLSDDGVGWTARVKGEEGTHSADYYFDPGGGRVTVLWFGSPHLPGTGWGTKKFERLKALWRADGFTEILVATAAGGPRHRLGWTGYYFWPSLGFVGNMSYAQRDRLPDTYRDVLRSAKSRRIEDLMALTGGRYVWRRYGGILHDLRYAL